jgi:hypothetical protein
VLFIDHLYPVSTHVVRPCDVHTLGNSLCCHQSEDLVTRRYPCPFSDRGIGSLNKKCFPTVALTLQSGMCSGSYVVLASESRSQMRLFRWTILVNPSVSTAASSSFLHHSRRYRHHAPPWHGRRRGRHHGGRRFNIRRCFHPWHQAGHTASSPC